MKRSQAFKKSTLIAYQYPWNCLTTHNDVVIEINSYDLSNKINSISCYESQKFRAYSDPGFIKSASVFAGSTIGVEYAETFEHIRSSCFLNPQY